MIQVVGRALRIVITTNIQRTMVTASMLLQLVMVYLSLCTGALDRSSRLGYSLTEDGSFKTKLCEDTGGARACTRASIFHAMRFRTCKSHIAFASSTLASPRYPILALRGGFKNIFGEEQVLCLLVHGGRGLLEYIERRVPCYLLTHIDCRT